MFDLTKTIVQLAAGGVGGAAQRVAWDQSRMVGMLATGGLLIGGQVLENMVRDETLREVGNTLSVSGATVAGWVGTEKLFISGGADADVGRLGPKAMSARSLGGRASSARARAIAAANGQSVNMSAQEMAAVPHASIISRNPRTGEPILSSAI